MGDTQQDREDWLAVVESTKAAKPPKSKVAAYALWLFLGVVGAHRFYLGSFGLGFAILILSALGFVTMGVTAVTAGIWLFVDAFLIPGMVDSYNAAAGNFA